MKKVLADAENEYGAAGKVCEEKINIGQRKKK